MTRDAGADTSRAEAAADVGRETEGDAKDAADAVVEVSPAPDQDLPRADASAQDDAPTLDAIDASTPAEDSEAGEASVGIDGSVLTTATILDAQSMDCLPCAARSGCLDPVLQGGTCETTPGTAPADCGPVLGATGAVSETEVCLAALNTIFTSGCAATSQGETPCLCGGADSTMCLAGTAAPAGPLAALYACDLQPADIDALVFRFTDQATGAGQANALVQCLAAFSCDCFGM